MIHLSIADARGALIANTAGLALFLVGMLLIYASRRLEEQVGIPILNGIVRAGFSVLVIYYLVTTGTAGVLVGLTEIDLLFAAVFAYYVLALPKLARP